MLTEKEELEYREQAERGRKAKTAMEFLTEYMIQARALVLHTMETGELPHVEDTVNLVMFLRVLRDFENSVKRYIDTGEIAERRLNEDGE